MRNAVLVGMVVLLAVMVAAPVSARTQSLYDSRGNVIGATEDGGQALHDRYGNRISAYEYANGYPEGGRRGGNSGYGGRQDNYGYSSGRRNGNQNRTSVNVGLGTRVGGTRVNLGYNKVTYSKPANPKPYIYKPEVVVYQPAPNVVTPAPKPTPIPTKSRMTLVQEVGDGLETISDIVVTNPEKVLVDGKHIVFSRAGKFFAEYVVDRVSGDSVFVETVDAPRGNPRQGDSFKIEDPPKDINVVE